MKRKYHWVESDKEIVLCYGSRVVCLSYYKKHGGSKAGLHIFESFDKPDHLWTLASPDLPY